MDGAVDNLSNEERDLLAWFAALDSDAQAQIMKALQQVAAQGESAHLEASVVHLLRRDLQQLLKIACAQRPDQP